MKLTSKNSITLYAIAVISLSACHEKKAEQQSKGRSNTLAAEGYVVRPEQFDNDYTTSGSLLPNEEIQLLSEVSGRVTSITFKEGATVKKGQVLLKIYNDDIKAQVQKLQAQRELQVKIKARQAELLNIGGISKQDYETTTTQIQSIDADVAFAEAQLRKTTIIAPFDGRIGIRNVSVGAVITPATVIATLQQTRTLKMDFTLPDQYRKEITNGKKVEFTVTGSLDTFMATISAIESSADAVTRTLKIRAMINNENNRLVAGSFAHVIIPFESSKNALLVPSQAIIPTTRDKEIAVVKEGKAKLIPVKIGARTNDKVEVLQGLSAGDTIITTGIMQVKNGMTVKITKMNTGAAL